MIRFKQYITELSQSAINKAKEKFKEHPEYVDLFNTLQSKGKMKGVDIFRLSWEELKKMVDENNVESKRQQQKKFHEFNPKEAPITFENDLVTVYHILSREMACKLGTNTHWCIAVKSKHQYWKDYTEDANIFYVIPKKPDLIYDVTGKKVPQKFAVLIDENGFMNGVFNTNDDNLRDGDYNNEEDVTTEWEMLKKFKIPFNKKVFIPFTGNDEDDE